MKKLFSLYLAILFASVSLNAQHSLEQIDLSPIVGSAVNTFPMGINNAGFVCGYYATAMPDTTGFVITPQGKIIEITWLVTGAGTYGIKAVSINDSNMVLVNYTDASGESKLYKVKVDEVSIVNSWPIVNNLNQSYVKAFHMNNKGDITGWYQGGVNRWMFTLHDGTPPAGLPAWNAWRYHIGVNPNYTYYNTMAGAMDTNRIATGFYIDGLNNIPVLYDEVGAEFYKLSGSNWCHPWGKNNSNKIVGEYKNVNGILNAFVASPTYTPGNLNSGQLNMTSLASIFHSSYYQSVARGINDKDEIVGSFIDTVNGNNYVGFIYRPNTPEYKIYNFDFNKHVWPMKNSRGNPGSGNVWTTNYYGGANYGTTDPFANNGYPLVEPHILADPQINTFMTAKGYNNGLPDSVSVDWKSWMEEIEGSSYYLTMAQTPVLMPAYRYLHKRNLFLKYIERAKTFGGICYGFAGASSIHLADDNYLDNTYGIGASKDFSTYDNQSKDAISTIVRLFKKARHPSFAQYFVDQKDNIKPWEGSYRAKRTWMDKDSLNYRQLLIGWFRNYDQNNNLQMSYHAVFPYKIKTPQKLPFFHNNVQNYDTMYVYDSNFPTDQNEYFLLKTDKVLNHVDSAWSPNHYPIPLFFVAFNEVSNSDLMSVTSTPFKKSRALDSIATMRIGPNANFLITDAATQNTAYMDATGYHSSINSLMRYEEKAEEPSGVREFLRDTIAELQISTTGYIDSLMSFSFDNDQVQMRLLRKAQMTETDYSTIKNRYVSYGNPDNVTKDIIASFSQLDPTLPTGCLITVTGLLLPQYDSIITINPANYQYQIIHPSNDTLSYTVNVLAIYNDTVKQFTAAGIPFTGPTSHVIDPYYNGPQGPQTIIKIDNGIDAIDDDTLFIVQVPLGINDVKGNVSYISLYPNPASDRINVQIAKQSNEDFQVVFTDIYGKMLLNEPVKHEVDTQNYTFDISAYSPGMYFLMVFDKNQKALFVEKVIKK